MGVRVGRPGLARAPNNPPPSPPPPLGSLSNGLVLIVPQNRLHQRTSSVTAKGAHGNVNDEIFVLILLLCSLVPPVRHSTCASPRLCNSTGPPADPAPPAGPLCHRRPSQPALPCAARAMPHSLPPPPPLAGPELPLFLPLPSRPTGRMRAVPHCTNSSLTLGALC